MSTNKTPLKPSTPNQLPSRPTPLHERGPSRDDGGRIANVPIHKVDTYTPSETNERPPRK